MNRYRLPDPKCKHVKVDHLVSAGDKDSGHLSILLTCDGCGEADVVYPTEDGRALACQGCLIKIAELKEKEVKPL